ncbi:MAG TPA: DUF4062 domain-containing protein [Opitutaceae bacterium]|jgi:hypothetical protein|nr:DUF4062 domain-containing protein [Opitutaceae bacterium]
MIPFVFISSTVRDLQHLRDSLRDCIDGLGYNAIMSEYGEIGYLPDSTAEDSCYSAMRNAQLAILIIGKRYSEPSENGMSVTENEYRTAVKNKIPIITLVDREVLAFKRIFDTNKKKEKIEFPGMDNAEKTFSFIDSVNGSELNNGFLEYNTTSDARKVVKQQLAHLFANLLSRRFDPIQAEIKDVLAEIKTLRVQIGKKGDQGGSREYMALFRYLLDDDNRNIRDLLKALKRDVGDVVVHLMKAENWIGFLRKIKIEYELNNDPDFYKSIHDKADHNLVYVSHFVSQYDPVASGNYKVTCELAIDRNNRLYFNQAALNDFDVFVSLAKEITVNADKAW